MVKEKVLQRSYLLKKIRWMIEQNEALTLYKRIILPFFELGNLFHLVGNKQ